MILIIILVLTLFLITIYIRKYNKWNKKGIKSPMALPVVGTFGSVMLVQESLDAYVSRVYNNYTNEKVVGLYAGLKPVLLVRDLELIKHIMVKDFHYFQDRGILHCTGGLSSNLFGSAGDTWKVLRNKLSAIFTSKKLKEMIPLMKKSLNSYLNYVDYLIDNNIDHEIKYLMSKYTLSVMGLCAYSINFNVYSNEMEELEKIGRKIFSPPMSVRIWFMMNFIVPGICAQFPMIDPAAKLREYFMTLSRSLILERERQISTRKDLVDLLKELKSEGRAFVKNLNGQTDIQIDDEIVAAQVFMFYGAGFETSSSTMCYILYELALNQKVQHRVYQEIVNVCNEYNDDINYESLKKMTYLTMVFNETLRKYPVLGTITRECVMDYTLPGTNIKIDEGTMIMFSVKALHYDPTYYTNPDEFNPENFSPGNINVPKGAFLPFGMGPRYCIGSRFAKLQSLMGIAAFLKKYMVVPSGKTVTDFRDEPESFSLTNRDGIWLKILRRE